MTVSAVWHRCAPVAKPFVDARMAHGANMSDPIDSWTESSLQELLGQPESIRREFKSGQLLEKNPQEKWVEELSKEISAFANTEGGELFIGIDEDKSVKVIAQGV